MGLSSKYGIICLRIIKKIIIDDSPHLGTVDVHVLRVLATLAQVSPVLAVNIVINTHIATLVTRHGAVGQHPAGVLLTLVHTGPVGAELVGVLTLGFYPGFLSWFRSGHLHSSTPNLLVSLALIQSVDLPDVSV